MSYVGWFYFGCGREAGHYCFDHAGQKHWPSGGINWNRFDGMLPPQPEQERYVASFSRLGGWGKAALSWWDGSVDGRPQSNSTVLCPRFNITPAEMYVEAQLVFPWVFARLPQQLTLNKLSENAFGPLILPTEAHGSATATGTKP